MYNCVTITANGNITTSKEHIGTCCSSHRFGGVILCAYGAHILLNGIEPTPEMVVREAFRVGGHIQMRLYCATPPGDDPVRDPFYSGVLLPLVERYSAKGSSTGRYIAEAPSTGRYQRPVSDGQK